MGDETGGSAQTVWRKYDKEKKINVWALLGFIFVIVGLVINLPGLFIVAAPLYVLGLIFSIVGLVRSGKPPYHSGRGFAITGVIIGGLGVIMAIVIFFFFSFYDPGPRLGQEFSTVEENFITNFIEAGDGFGSSVAISGNTIVVGSQSDDVPGLGNGGGTVTILQREGDKLNEIHKISSPDPSSNGFFGAGVDIDGDYIIIGENNGEHDGLQNGRAYIMEQVDGQWSTNLITLPRDTTYTEAHITNHGNRVVISEDREIAFVAAYTDIVCNGTCYENAGKVYVYEKVNGEWELTHEITQPDVGNNNHFGKDIDYEPSSNILVISGPGDRYDEVRKERVYIYENGDWDNPVILDKPVGDDADGLFGESISIDAGDIVVGSPGIDTIGRFYVYRMSDLDSPGSFGVSSSVASNYFGSKVLVRDGEMFVRGKDPDEWRMVIHHYSKKDTGLWESKGKLRNNENAFQSNSDGFGGHGDRKAMDYDSGTLVIGSESRDVGHRSKNIGGIFVYDRI